MPAHVTVERVADVSPGRRQVSADLVVAARELMLASAVTALDSDNVVAARLLVEEATRLLGARTRSRSLRPDFDEPARARATLGERSYSMGVHNPVGPPLDIVFDGDTARGTVTANALFEGPPDCLHGGWSAWLMDSVLGVLVQSEGARAVTASLELRYLKRTPLDAPLELAGRIVERSGRTLVLEGSIEHEGQRTVEARGVFVRIDGATR